MPRVLIMQLDDGKTFEVPVRDCDGENPVLETKGDGFSYVFGLDGEIVVVHKSRIAWVSVVKDKPSVEGAVT